MRQSQLNRVLNLIRRAGDRCLILDKESDDVFALLRLDDYEDLRDNFYGDSLEELSEKEIMDKVERDLSIWRASHEDKGGDFDEEVIKSEEPIEKINLEGENEEDIIEGAEIEPDGWREETETMPLTTNHELRIKNDEKASEKDKATTEIAPSAVGEMSVIGETEGLEDLPSEDENTFLLEPV